MPTFALAAAGAGFVSAALHAALLTGSLGAVMFAYLAQLPLFLVGLWMGATAAMTAGITAVAVLAAAGGTIFAITYLLVNAVPAVILSYLAQLNRPAKDGGVEWYPAVSLVAWLVGLAALGFLGLNALLSGGSDGAEGVISRFIAAGLRDVAATEIDPASLIGLAATVARFFPGLVAASWIGMVIVNAVLAQGVLARLGRNFRPSPAMADIVDLPSWMRGAILIAAVGTFLPGHAGFIGSNLLMIFVLAYALAGLGIIHVLVARAPSRGLVLGAVYAFVFMFGWPLVVAALLGLAEPWLNLRRRVAGGPRI